MMILLLRTTRMLFLTSREGQRRGGFTNKQKNVPCLEDTLPVGLWCLTYPSRRAPVRLGAMFLGS